MQKAEIKRQLLKKLKQETLLLVLRFQFYQQHHGRVLDRIGDAAP